MTYEKNTWANGDVITAAKLNNMEDGIANAGSAGRCLVTVTTEGFGNNEEFDLGYVCYAEEVESGQYAGQIVQYNKGTFSWVGIFQVGNETTYYNMQLPPVNDFQLMFCFPDEDTNATCSVSGNISTTPVTFREEPGLSRLFSGYAITGDCSITITDH